VIRQFDPLKDSEQLRRLHASSKLPKQCLPDTDDPLFLHIAVTDVAGKMVMASALRGSCEIYVLVDHEAGTPQDRLQWLAEIKDYMAQKAFRLGLDQITAWVPKEIEPSFGPRLEDLGFTKSPWQSYTLNV
jgi:hypothetical protein